MAVLKREYNISTYQERQLNALLDISKKMNDITRYTAVQGGTFAAPLSKFHTDLKSWLAPTIVTTGKVLAISLGKMVSANKESVEAFDDISDLWVEASKSLEDSLKENTISLDISTERNRRSDRRRARDEESAKKRADFLGRVGSQVGNMIARLAGILDGMAESLNNMMVLTGESMSVIKGFRGDITGVVSSLNAQTGGQFNALDAISTMVTVMNSANIRNTETLQGIGEGILISNKTLDVNLGSMSKYMARSYELYNFSSTDQKRFLTDFLQSTQGKNVSAEDVLSIINDPTLLNQMYLTGERISSKTGRSIADIQNDAAAQYATIAAKIADERLDTTNTNFYTEAMKSIYSGGMEARQNIAKLGLNFDDLQAMLNDNRITEVFDLLVKGVASRQNVSAADKAELYKAWGFDQDLIENAYIQTRQGYQSATEDYIANQDKNVDILKQVSEQAIPIQDRIFNKLSEFFTSASDFFTSTKVALSDLTSLYLLFKVFSAGKGLSDVLTSIGIGKAISAAGKGVAGAAGGAGAAAKSLASKALGPTAKAAVGGAWTTLGPMLSTIVPGLPVIVDTLQRQGVLPQTPGLWGDDKEITPQELDTIKVSAEKNRLTVASLLNRDYPKIVDYLSDRYLNEISENNDYTALESFISSIAQKAPLGKEYDEGFFNKYVKSMADHYKTSYGLENMPAYRTGINYIPRDQIAMLHKGEAVVPERYNPAAHETELERLRSKEQTAILETNNEMIAAIREIRDFLRLWKTEGEIQKRASAIEDRQNSLSIGLLSGIV